MHTRHWTRKSGRTLKRGAAARGRAAGPKAQGRAIGEFQYAGVGPGVQVGGGISGPVQPRPPARGRERIPNSILDGEKLWEGGRPGSSARAWGRLFVWAAAREAPQCGGFGVGAAGSVACVSVTRGVAAGWTGAAADGSPLGSDRSLAGAQRRLGDKLEVRSGTVLSEP
jgi:hypothetical protein